MAGKKRFPGPPPRILGRGVQQYLVELQDWLYKLWQSLAIIITQGFEDITPEDVAVTPDPGTETDGWAAADHVHRLGIVSERGDLITHDGTDPTALPIGTPGQVLTVDPTLLPEWADPVGAGASVFDGCISFWRMEEAAGQRLDSIGSAGFNDLTPVNSVTQVAGKIGFAAGFDVASSRYLHITDAAQHGLNPGLSSFSVSKWFYAKSPFNPPLNYLVGKGATGGGAFREGYSIFATGAGHATPFRLASFFGDNTNSRITGWFEEFSLDAWHNLVVVVDRGAGEQRGYLDGVRLTPNPVAPADITNVTLACNPNADFAIGAFSQNAGAGFGDYWDGSIDAVGFWNRVLTEAEVTELYADGNGRELSPLWSVRDAVSEADLISGCVSSYRFEEATGLVRQDSIGRLGSNPLTPNGGPTFTSSGKLGGAVLFVAASSQNLEILDSVQRGLNPNLSDLAISTWFYPIGTTGAIVYGLVGKGATGGVGQIEGYWIPLYGSTHATLPRRLSAIFGDSVAAVRGCQFHTTDQYNLNAWNHLFVYYDRDGECFVALNGIKQAPFGGSSALMDAFGVTNNACNPNGPFRLGDISQNGGGGAHLYFDGRMDATQVFVFDNSLLPGQVAAMAAALWNNGAGREIFPIWTTRRSFGITIDGGGAAITPGQKGYVQIPFSGTISRWGLVGNAVGSIVIDVWRDTFAASPPTVADTITGTEKPTLAAQQQAEDSALTSWSRQVNAGDVVGFNVDSVAGINRVTLTVWVDV